MSSIFVLNRQEKVVGVLKNTNSNTTPFFDDLFVEDLSTGAETFQFTTISKNGISKHLQVGNYIAFKKDKKYKLLEIISVEEDHQEELYITVYCESAGIQLINSIFRGVKITSATFQKVITALLADTGWGVGGLPYGLNTTFDLDIPQNNVYALLQSYSKQYEVEIEFRVEINRGRISKKYVDAYYNRGRVTGKRFTYNRDIESIVRKTDTTNLYTALIGKGTNGITFRDVVIEGIDKPAGQDFVADQTSYDKYNNNGYHIMGVYEFETESPEELLLQTYKHLQDVKDPRVEYNVGVILLSDLIGEKFSDVRIGDTIGVFDNAFDPPIMVAARVSKLETSMTDKNANKCTLANFIEVSSNITDEMRKIASELEGYVEDKFNNKFPIGSEDIDKGAIKEQHIYRDSITTEHLQADSITADKIDANQIKAEHILAGEIKARHIDADQINAYHIEAGSITADSAIIADLAVGTAQIADAAITVAKIETAFIDKIVAKEGKFESAHIGVLTADNISSKTITAEHIKGTVIDAINMNVSGKISADRIDVSSLTVEDIDAGKITTGTLDADRIGANSIDASKLTISDMTNLAVYFQNKADIDSVYDIEKRDTQLGPSTMGSDLDDGSEFIFEAYCKTFNETTTLPLLGGVFVYFTDGTVDYNTVSLAVANDNRQFTKRIANLKLKPFGSKIPKMFYPVLQISKPSANTTVEKWQVKQISVRRKNNGKLIVDGSIKANHLDVGSVTTDKIDAGAITADLITSSVVQAINMSAAKIDAKNINTENLVVKGELIAGDITAEVIQSNVIAAINSYAGAAKIKQAQIETLKVGNANIVDLDASKIKTGKLSADRIDVDKIIIKDANITGTITASKISGGTLDASKMTVKNLKADSITAGSITVEGNNLIHNTDFTEKGTGWSGNGQIDANTTYSRYNSLKITGVGSEYSEFVSAYYGESFVITMNTLLKTSTGIPTTLPLVVFEEFAEKTSQRIAYQENAISNVPDNWKRHFATYKVSKQETKFVRIRLYSREAEKVVWFNQPMLSRGTIASVWKLHNDELISDGAIDNDKIKDEAITSDKLNVQELFVGDNAFIKNLKAVEIDAAQITTGKIQGERIDINGLVSFEALDTTLQPLFDVTGNKTYINGGMIAANTIKANSIDLLSGLTVRGADNTVTFSIAENGEVEVNGLLRSGNFDEDKKTGYKISTDGKAILNEATVRGNVILPNAGITNDYDMSKVDGRNLLQKTNQGVSGWGWGMQTGGRTFTEVIEDGISCCKIVRDNVAQTGWSYLNYANFDPKVIKPSTKYTLSFEVKSSVATTFQFRLSRGDSKEALTDFSNTSISTVANKWTKIEITTTSFDELPVLVQYGQVVYIAGMNSSVGVSYIFKNLILQEGEVENAEWIPAPEDNLNPVRIWAGSSYDLKDNAPFRVMQNGDVYATNGVFSGKMFGALDAGLVHIHNNEIVINSTETYVDEYGIERVIQPRDYNPNPYLRLGEGQSLINTDLVLGSETDKRIIFLNDNRSLTFNQTSLNLVSPTKGGGANVKFNPKGDYHNTFEIESNVTNTDASLAIGYHGSSTWENTTIITHVGSKGVSNGDICFKRTNNEEDIDILIQGNLKVKNKIQSNIQNIEIRSVKGEGWGFYSM